MFQQQLMKKCQDNNLVIINYFSIRLSNIDNRSLACIIISFTTSAAL